MHVDSVEGHFIAKMQGHHDHPRHPEKDDVKARDEHGTGVEQAQLLGFLWPAQSGKGP